MSKKQDDNVKKYGNHVCPLCGYPLIKRGGCQICTSCGYEKCSM